MATKIQQPYSTKYKEIKSSYRSAYNSTKSLREAAGLLKDRYADLKKHYRRIRGEWLSYTATRR